jgi:hypothetical protein
VRAEAGVRVQRLGCVCRGWGAHAEAGVRVQRLGCMCRGRGHTQRPVDTCRGRGHTCRLKGGQYGGGALTKK